MKAGDWDNALFSAFDGNHSQKTVPIQYSYTIQKHDAVIYKSGVKSIEAMNGAKTPLEIKLKAASREGDYKVVLNLSQQKGNAQKHINFSIVTAEEAKLYAAKNRLEPLHGEGTLEDRL